MIDHSGLHVNSEEKGALERESSLSALLWVIGKPRERDGQNEKGHESPHFQLFGKDGGWGLKVPIEQYTVVNIAVALRAEGGAV
ncbi:MAG: hypothetical protein ACKVP0_18270 [Pirellulaceae bacterium]